MHVMDPIDKSLNSHFDLLIISSMYEGYLHSFYKKHQGILKKSFTEHYESLLSDSCEFVASYTRSLIRHGINTTAIISNDKILQGKWRREFGQKKGDVFLQQIGKYKPDVLWIEDIRFMNEETLSSIKTIFPFIKLIFAYHCAPFGAQSIRKFEKFDFIITCTPGLKDQFEAHGLSAFLVYHGFDIDLLPSIKSDNITQEIIFSGSLKQGRGYHLERIRLIDYLLKNGVNISLYINLEDRLIIIAKKSIRLFYKILKYAGVEHPEKIHKMMEYGMEPVISYPQTVIKAMRLPVFGSEMYNLLSRSKIVLNNHGEVAGNYAGNMRIFEATGAGSCLLTDKKSNLADLFEEGREVVSYENEEECLNKIKWLLANEEERKKIAFAGHRKTLSNHTVSNRCERIVEIIRAELNHQ
jgi:spore maturation protein CgeB